MYDKQRMSVFVQTIRRQSHALSDRDLTTINVVACGLENDTPLEPVWVRAVEQLICQYGSGMVPPEMRAA